MLVSTYGTLMKGYSNHRYLNGSRLIGKAVIEGYDMYSLGFFPGIVPGKGTVQGEVYEVTIDTLAILDRLEGHPKSYKREQIRLSEANGHVAKGQLVRVYIWKLDVFPSHRIESGDWQSR